MNAIENFKATITDHQTGEILAYTQDTLDEFKVGLKNRGIKGSRLAGPVKHHPKNLTLTATEREWLGMTVSTDFGRGEIFSMGPLPKTVWAILDAGSTDRMVCLRFDQCRKVSSWQKRAEPIPLILV